MINGSYLCVAVSDTISKNKRALIKEHLARAFCILMAQKHMHLVHVSLEWRALRGAPYV